MSETGRSQVEATVAGGRDQVPLERLDERYARLRIPRPLQERAVAESMRRFGQLTPLVVCPREQALAVVDGFKRVHAAQALGLESLEVRALPLSEQAAVAAIHGFNQHHRGLVDLEEGLIVQTLCREHGLSQVEVGELLGRHKSWVCRRLMLVERLDGQVAEDVRVGMVSTTTAREIARLPRGNQAEVAAAAFRSGLTSREAAVLVSLFEGAGDRARQEELLQHPRQAVTAHLGRAAAAPHDPRLSPEHNHLRRLVLSVVDRASRLLGQLADAQPAGWSAAERSLLVPLLRQAAGTTSLLVEGLAGLLDATKETHGR